jgi:hypothetical protein
MQVNNGFNFGIVLKIRPGITGRRRTLFDGGTRERSIVEAWLDEANALHVRLIGDDDNFIHAGPVPAIHFMDRYVSFIVTFASVNGHADLWIWIDTECVAHGSAADLQINADLVITVGKSPTGADGVAMKVASFFSGDKALLSVAILTLYPAFQGEYGLKGWTQPVPPVLEWRSHKAVLRASSAERCSAPVAIQSKMRQSIVASGGGKDLEDRAKAASHFLTQQLGQKWAARAFSEADSEFAWSPKVSSEEKRRSQLRTILFAQAVANMKGMPGFDSRMSDLKHLGGAYAETLAGTALALKGIRFQWVQAHGVKGSDCEILFVDDLGGEVGFCEVKAKVASTALSLNTLTATLRDASEQVPRGKPTVLFLRLPDPWVETEGFESVIDRALERHFEREVTGSSPMVSVVLMWEEFDGLSSWRLRTRVHWNPYSIRGISVLEEFHQLLASPTSDYPDHWVTFEALT